MLRSANQSVSAEIDQMVEGLLREDLEYERTENRTAHREALVRSAVIDYGSGRATIEGFSRNISHSGIGIITEDFIADRSSATLILERLDGTYIKILAECRWCKPYGKKWNISGWQFLNLR